MSKRRKKCDKAMLKQRVMGIMLGLIAIASIILSGGDCSFAVFALPVAIYMLATKEHILVMYEKR